MTKVTQSTLLMDLETGQYPLRSYSLRHLPRLKNKLIPRQPTVQQLANLGIVVVHNVPMPSGDVVTEGTPIQATEGMTIVGVEEVVVGDYYQNWVVREFTADEIAQRVQNKKSELLSQLKNTVNSVINKGVPYTFPGNVVNHIQLRDGDRANITGLRVGAESDLRAMENDPNFVPRSNLGFRTYENVFFPMTPEQIVALSDFAFAAYTSIKATEWMYEGLINEANTLEELQQFNMDDIREEMYNVEV